MSTTHPRHHLDELIHSPVRLSLMAALAAADSIDFRTLRDLVEVSDSLLSKHLSILERAGYVTARKGHEGKWPRTWLSLTATGRDAYARYLTTLHSITTQHRSSPSGRGAS